MTTRQIPYCNLTTDLQNAYMNIEFFAHQNIDYPGFTAVPGQLYSQMGRSGYVGALYVDRVPYPAATSVGTIDATNAWYYDSSLDTLYLWTAYINGSEITVASDSWENIKESAREDASQEVENYLYMYNRPLPFRKNSGTEYDRDIVRAVAYLTCARIIEISDPTNELAENLRMKVWDDEGERGIIYDYAQASKKKFSFEATTKSYNGNIVPVTQEGTGYPEVAGYSDNFDAYEYKIDITTGGEVGTAQYSLYKNNTLVGTKTTYENYIHLHDNVYVKFAKGTYNVGDQWLVQFDGRKKDLTESGLGTILLVQK